MIYNKKAILLDGVKIYIDDLQNYLAESYMLLFHHNKYNEFTLHKYINQEKRKDYFNLLVDAYLHNYNNIRDLLLRINPYVEVDGILNTTTSKDNVVSSTLKDYLYLCRDWCYYEEGETQINITIKAIKNSLPTTTENALFLGCGAGRLAVEFSNVFSKIYATDKSYSMIWHINKLISDNNFEFYTPLEKNVYSLSNVAKKHIAQIPKNTKSIIQEKLDFFVSDVLNLPIKEESIECVFSIYFTDVIALKLWFDKINGIIKKGGYFIHFGPLDYFFSVESEMLTAKEFKSFFETNGYTTITDQLIETPHLNDSNSLVYKVYRNWLFIAKKN